MPQHQHTHSEARNDSSLPVVLWHGMGDSCCASYSIGYVAELISSSLGARPTSQEESQECWLTFLKLMRACSVQKHGNASSNA